MVEIVTPGKDLDAPIEAECGFCHCVIRFKPSEATRYDNAGIADHPDFFLIVCPTCAHDIRKDITDLPEKEI